MSVSDRVNCSSCKTYLPEPAEVWRDDGDFSESTLVFWFLVREGSDDPTEMAGIEEDGEIALRFRALTRPTALRRPGYKYFCPDCLAKAYPEHIEWEGGGDEEDPKL